MRLSADHVKLGILHADQGVRLEAVHYFSDSFSRDPAIMPLVGQAIERFGWQAAFSSYSLLTDLVQTNDSLSWFIGQLESIGTTDDADGKRIINACRSALIHASPELLRSQRGRLSLVATLDQDAQRIIDEQIELSSMPPQDLWRRLKMFCDRYDGKDAATDEQYEGACRVIKALGRHGGWCDDRVLSILSGETEDFENWWEGFAVILAGEIRLEPAVPFLLEKLKDADDWVYDESPRALTKIGTDDVVRRLAKLFPKEDWDLQNSAGWTLFNIHSDFSLETCLRLAQLDLRTDIRSTLLQAALSKFATAAIEPARQFVLKTPLDPHVLEVRWYLLTACKLLGERFPEFDTWVEDSKNDQEFRKQWYAQNMPPLDAEDFWDDEDDATVDTSLMFADDDEPNSLPLQLVSRNERVGRNDPCPCGSGKKYKKCCHGRKGVAIETDLNHAAAMSGVRPPKAPKRYPIGTLALYGPDDRRTTKMVAAVIQLNGAEPVLQRWVGSDVTDNPKTRRQIEQFFHKHQVRSVVATDRNIGCPHEEGEDFPLGEDCPFCPFWKGKQGTAARD